MNTANRHEQILTSLHEEMSMIHSDYDKNMVVEIAKVFFDAVDKQGFVFDFDLAWKWAGYLRKGHAKDVLVGKRKNLGLKEGVDYKILISADAEIRNKGENGGDRRSEKIMMTSRCFCQFALAAGTTNGQILRDVVIALTRLMKSLVVAVQTGTHKIVRVEQGDTRANKRLKVCDTQKALMQEVVCKNPDFARFCGRINGETNKAVTGSYKYETARMLNKPSRSVNARDYMTPEQLSAAELVEMLSREAIEESGGNIDPLALHTSICNDVVANIRERLHGKRAPAPLNLRLARAEQRIDQIEDRVKVVENTQQKNVNTINKYFGKK